MPDTVGGVPRGPASPDAATLAAFVCMVLIGGSNAVAVRFSNQGLPPFWGAALRSLLAAAIFWAILLIRRSAPPRGRALVGAAIYGGLAVGAGYAFGYWGILRIRADLFMVILSLGPLFTMMLAAAHGLERFTLRGLLGAVVAVAGIALGIGTDLGHSVPVTSLLAVVASAALMAEGSVVYKLFPEAKPLATNAVAFTIGGAMLLIVSAIAGEVWSVPSDPRTVAAFSYLTTVGTVGLFYLYLLVLSRWTATATSYGSLLFPIATMLVAVLLTDESVTWQFLLGSAIALGGVWIGALGTRTRQLGRQPQAPVTTERCDPPYPRCV